LSNNDADSKGTVVSFQFVDAKNGWGIEGWQHNIVRTEDGGETWAIKELHPTSSWTSVFFDDPQHGWAIGRGLAHTSDGGATWNYQVDPERSHVDFNGMTFLDTKRGWAVAHDKAFRTEDGGENWRELSNDWTRMLPLDSLLKLQWILATLFRGVLNLNYCHVLLLSNLDCISNGAAKSTLALTWELVLEITLAQISANHMHAIALHSCTTIFAAFTTRCAARSGSPQAWVIRCGPSKILFATKLIAITSLTRDSQRQTRLGGFYYLNHMGWRPLVPHSSFSIVRQCTGYLFWKLQPCRRCGLSD